MKTKFTLILFILLVVTRVSSHAQGNLILNGGFEDGAGSFTNWTTINEPQGAVDIGIKGGGLIAANPPEGSYFAGFLFAGGSIMQTIGTVPGVYYALSLSAIQFQGTNNVSVDVNGSLLATLNFNMSLPIIQRFYSPPFVTNWQNFTYIFQATSNLTMLTFNCYNQFVYDAPDNDTYYGASALDAISVMAVPEPAPSFLILLGSGVLIYIRQRNYRSK